MDNKDRDMYCADIIAAMAERTIKRLWIALIVVVLVLFATVTGFLMYLNQYDFESYEYTQDGEGLNLIGANRLNGVDIYEPESQD